MEPLSDVLTITLTERDKRALKVKAASDGVTMADIIRRLIRDQIADRKEADTRDGLIAVH